MVMAFGSNFYPNILWHLESEFKNNINVNYLRKNKNIGDVTFSILAPYICLKSDSVPCVFRSIKSCICAFHDNGH